jgi:hypothetical protein
MRSMLAAFLLAPCSLIASASGSRADSYTVLESTLDGIAAGQTIDAQHLIDLPTGKLIVFVVSNGESAVQRRCTGPYKGEIRRCTNTMPTSRVGVPGGSRGSDD